MSFFSCLFIYGSLGGGGVGWGMLTFMGLAHLRDATLLHVLFKLYNYVMLGDVNVHGTCTLTWCYATARSLQVIQLRDATLLHVLFKLYNYVTLRYCTFSSSYTTTWCWGMLTLWQALAEECRKKSTWNFRRAGKELKKWWKCCAGFQKRMSSVSLTVLYSLDSWWTSIRMCKNLGFLKQLISSVQMRWA